MTILNCTWLQIGSRQVKNVLVSHLSKVLLLLFILILLGLFIIPQHSKEVYEIFPPVFINYSTTTTIPGPRLLCMVLTTPSNYLTKTVHVQATWGRRCDTLLFLSSSEKSWSDQPYPAEMARNIQLLELDGVLGRKRLWDKVKLGISITWRDYRGQFDFLIKADDDTFLIVDNLKHLLSQISPREPLILGHHQEDRDVEYFSGGPGYVLSHAAVKEIVEVGLSGDRPCQLPHPVGREVEVYPNEDLQMGKCASLLNIKFQSSEVDGQSTFFPFSLEQHLVPGLMVQWWVERTKECVDEAKCVSPALISMHYVRPDMMYVFDYFVYGFKREI